RAAGAVRVRRVALRHAELLPARHPAADCAGLPAPAVYHAPVAGSGAVRVRPARPGADRASARPDHRSDAVGPGGALRAVRAHVLVLVPGPILRDVPVPGARGYSGSGARAAGPRPRLPDGGPPAVQHAGARSLLFRSPFPVLPMAGGASSLLELGSLLWFLFQRRGGRGCISLKAHRPHLTEVDLAITDE